MTTESDLEEANDLLADCFAQMAIDYGDGWMGDGALSTCEELARYLLRVGRLEEHPARRWYRWKDKTA